MKRGLILPPLLPLPLLVLVLVQVLVPALAAALSQLEEDFGVLGRPAQDVRLEGFLLQTLPGARGFSACLRACQDTSGCQSINFFREEGRCQLNSASGTSQAGSLLHSPGVFQLDLAPALQFEAGDISPDVCPAHFVIRNVTFGAVYCMRLCELLYGPLLPQGTDLQSLELGDSLPPLTAPCHGAGWVVFNRRVGGGVDYTVNWQSFQDGFGDVLSGDFWLGNDALHRLTNAGFTELRVDLWDWDLNMVYAHYSQFAVGSAAQNFVLSVSGYSGNAGDDLTPHDGSPFSTATRQNGAKGGCAGSYSNGWWYGGPACFMANLNGEWRSSSSTGSTSGGLPLGVLWYSFKGYYYSLRKAEMKVRRPPQ